eukprot:723040-Hanusia_phi.AAC.1
MAGKLSGGSREAEEIHRTARPDRIFTHPVGNEELSASWLKAHDQTDRVRLAKLRVQQAPEDALVLVSPDGLEGAEGAGGGRAAQEAAAHRQGGVHGPHRLERLHAAHADTSEVCEVV